MKNRLRVSKSKFYQGWRVAHYHLAQRPHNYLTKRSRVYRRWHTLRLYKYVHTAMMTVAGLLVIGVISTAVHQAYAQSTWTQTDWSGGVGVSTTTQYSSATNVDPTGTPGQLGLPNALTFSGNEITDTTRTTNSQGDGVTPPDSSTGMWENTTNLVRNGGLETNTTDWVTSNGSGSNGTISQVSTGAKFGSKAIQFADTATTGNWSFLMNNFHSYAATPNFNTAAQYTLSFWAKTTSVSGSTNVTVEICDSSSTNFVMTAKTANLSSGWTRYSYTFTPAIAGNTPQIIFSVPPAEVPLTFQVDGVQLEQKAYPTPYVDTNGSTASRPAAHVQAPLATTNMTQGWYAARVRMDTASSSNGNQTIGQLYVDSNDRLVLRANSGTTWSILNWSGGVNDSGLNVTSNYSAGSIVTVVYYWTSTTLNISINGGAFTTVSRASVPPGVLTAFDIGSQLGTAAWMDGDILWGASGTGTLTNADASTLNALGNSDPSFSSLQTLNSGAANPTIAWDGTSTTYATTGSLSSSIFDGTLPSDWGNLTYTANTPSGTSVSVKVRGGNQPDLSDAPAFSSCSPISSGSDVTSSCLPNKSRYAQYQVTLNGSSTATPNLQDISIAYSASDITPPPTNASGLAMYRSNGGASVASDGWTNTDPYFTWTAGADESGGSGIIGYCLYLGQDPTGNPITTEGDLGTSPLNTNGACPFAISTNNINTALAGYIGTALTTSNSPYYLNVKAIDNAGNVYNGSPAQFEFRYDNAPPTNPAFISAPSEFVSNKQVTLTWPTTGSDVANDGNSGVAGLQYRIGSSGTWYGDNHNGNQDATDLLNNDGSYTTINNPDFANLVDGNNIVYFRTLDNAGNISAAYVTTAIKINTTAPSSPQNLSATPTTNVTNSFGFSWLAPATYTGSASNITYCYSVNSLPTSSSCTYTVPGQTSLDAGAYATEPGDNTFYLVAKDEAGNINYATAASVTFTANTPAPGVPLNADIADISVKVTSNWKLALSWETPSSIGAGVSTYKIFRSTNNSNFTDIASTAGTSYVDSGLSQRTYYYKVQACDSANNCGAFTSVVSLLPTGKFTSPATLISDPAVTTTTRTANITWTTDRTSDSSVEYGLSPGHYYTTEAANTNQVTSHTVGLNSLTAGTTYYYRAQWTDMDGNEGTSAEGSFTTLPSPTISNVSAGNINLTTATIQFTSKNATAVQLQYGGGVLSNTQNLNTSTSTSTYSIPLNNLKPGTTYSFKLNPYDTSGNIYDNPTAFTFTTPPQPVITNVQFQPVPGALTGAEQISWTTNVPASSQISYGLVNGSRQNQLDTTMTTTHTMTVSDLAYNTSYSITATSVDVLGNVATSDLQIFKSGVDTRPPTVSGLTIQPSIVGNGASAKGQLIVSWKTDKQGTSQVTYGQGAAGDYTVKTAENAVLVTNHVVVVSGLSTSQVYHVQVISDDAEGVRGFSRDQTTIIGHASDNALSIVFNALQSIFGL
jgi:hypothetical protein